MAWFHHCVLLYPVKMRKNRVEGERKKDFAQPTLTMFFNQVQLRCNWPTGNLSAAGEPDEKSGQTQAPTDRSLWSMDERKRERERMRTGMWHNLFLSVPK